MNKYIYGLIFSLVMELNTSSLICAGAEEECLLLQHLPKVSGKPRHGRTLSQEQMGNLEQLMATGEGRRGRRSGKSLPGSRQYDSTEIEELLKVVAKRNGADSTFDDMGNKREFRGGDFEKWQAGEQKWLERQEERAAKKRYIEQLAGEDADEGDVNLVLISSFNLNAPVLSFSSYLASEKEKKEEVGSRTAAELLGAELLKELEEIDVNAPLI